MSSSSKVRAFFEQRAAEFDRLYAQGTRMSIINRLLRRPFYRRFDLTMAECGDVRGKRILDIGCGSGRYLITLARRGAEGVGIDFASNMIALAQNLAAERGVADRCLFVNADFLEFEFEKKFDISLAIGLFDYIRDPTPILSKMRSLTREKVIVTFPPAGGWRAFQRLIRYRLYRCPLYFHSQESMTNNFKSTGFENWRFKGSWVVAFPPDKRRSQSLPINEVVYE
jgi:SAM-dependent methyltransferase